MNTTIYKPEYNNSWALVIGINEYRNLSPLRYACNDAEAVATLLKDRFDFPKKNVTALTDKAATRSTIIKSFLKFAGDDVSSDDRILVFFAGHGHTISGRRGEVGYLIPVDGKPDDLSSLIRWDDLTRNSELIHAKHVLFIMDACYGGLAITRALPAGSMRFLRDMLQRYSRQVLTAGKADEIVSDSGGPISGHSVFTGHFLQALEGNAASGDGIITANGVMSYVYEKVSKDQHSRQTPHYGFLDGDGDFIFKAPILNSIQKDEEIGKDILVEVPSILTEVPDTGLDVIERIKEYISDERYRIKLDDLVTREIRRVLSLTTNDSFPVQTASVTSEEFFHRLRRYESVADNLQKIVVSLSHWGGQNYIPVLRKIIARMADPHGPDSGKTVWLNLRWYPTIILMYSGGIGAIAADNYENLAAILTTKVGAHDGSDKDQEVILLVGRALVELERSDIFKTLPDHQRYYVPRSEYLFKLFQPILDDLLFLGRSYETMFDRFEILLALIHADMDTKNGRSLWGPVGRFGWKHNSRMRDSSIFSELKKEAELKQNEWPPLKAGLFDGSYERFKEISVGYEEQILNRLNWF